MNSAIKAFTVLAFVFAFSGSVNSQTVPKQIDHPRTGPEVRQGEVLDEASSDFAEKMKLTIDEALDAMRTFNVIDDPNHYVEYEVSPNGDIILRRRSGAPVLPVKRPVAE